MIFIGVLNIFINTSIIFIAMLISAESGCIYIIILLEMYDTALLLLRNGKFRARVRCTTLTRDRRG